MPDALGALPEPPFSDETVRLVVAHALASDRVSLVITRADGLRPIIWASESFATLTGYSVDETLGRSYDFLHGPGTDKESVTRMRARLDDGDTNTVLLYRRDGTAFWDRVVVVPIRDSAGRSTHHATIHTDATADVLRDLRQATDDALTENRAVRIELITKTIGAMTEQVDYRQAAGALVRAAVPRLGDWGFVILFDDDGRLDFTAVAADPHKHRSARIVEASIQDALGGVTWAGLIPGMEQVLDTKPGRPVLPVLQDTGLVTRLAPSERVKRALYDLGLGAWLALPLNAWGRRLGLMVLQARNPLRFDAPTVATATLLRTRVGQVLGALQHYQDRAPDLVSLLPEAHETGGDEPPLDSSPEMAIAVRALQTADLPVMITEVPTGRIVWANDPYCRMVGWSRAELVGRSWTTVHTEQPDETYIAQKIDAVRGGSAATMTLLCRRQDGTRFWSRMAVAPVRDSHGQIAHTLAVHAAATGPVVTEHVHAAEAELAANRSSRLMMITRTVNALTEQDDYHQAADTLARTAVPELADWGFVALFDDDGRPEYFTDIVTDPARLTSARIAGQEVRDWFYQHYVLDATAQKAQPEDLILPRLIDVNQLEKAVPTRPVLDALQSLGLGASLSVPLFARDRTLGMLVLQARDPDRFDMIALVTTTLLRSRVSIVLDNIRLYQTERRAALTLQQRLLPPTITVDGLDTATVYQPSANRAEVGGDWYDVFSLDERGTMLAVGDVVGHDMSAAAAMGQLSVVLRARSWNAVSPGPVLSSIVQTLDGMRWDDVASVACLRWQPTDDGGSHVEYANLGHPAPFVRLPDGTVHQMPPAHGLPLGLHRPTVEVHQDQLDLPPGAVVVLFTDGLVERRDRPLKEGLADLAQALRDAPDGTSAQIRDYLLTALVRSQPEDDLCLLVVRQPRPSTDRSA